MRPSERQPQRGPQCHALVRSGRAETFGIHTVGRLLNAIRWQSRGKIVLREPGADAQVVIRGRERPPCEAALAGDHRRLIVHGGLQV